MIEISGSMLSRLFSPPLPPGSSRWPPLHRIISRCSQTSSPSQLDILQMVCSDRSQSIRPCNIHRWPRRSCRPAVGWKM